MGYNQASGVSGMLKSGHQTYEGTYGAVLKNIEAGKSMASMVGFLSLYIALAHATSSFVAYA